MGNFHYYRLISDVLFLKYLFLIKIDHPNSFTEGLIIDIIFESEYFKFKINTYKNIKINFKFKIIHSLVNDF